MSDPERTSTKQTNGNNENGVSLFAYLPRGFEWEPKSVMNHMDNYLPWGKVERVDVKRHQGVTPTHDYYVAYIHYVPGHFFQDDLLECLMGLDARTEHNGGALASAGTPDMEHFRVQISKIPRPIRAQNVIVTFKHQDTAEVTVTIPQSLKRSFTGNVDSALKSPRLHDLDVLK